MRLTKFRIKLGHSFTTARINYGFFVIQPSTCFLAKTSYVFSTKTCAGSSTLKKEPVIRAINKILLSIILIMGIAPLPGLGQMKILDLDPNLLAPTERATWAKIQNDARANKLFLRVFRLDKEGKEKEAEKPVYDLRIEKEGLSNVPLVVNQDWFGGPVTSPRDYKFLVELFDNTNEKQSTKNLTVQSNPDSYFQLASNQFSWLVDSKGIDYSILVKGRVERISASNKNITFTIEDGGKQMPIQMKYEGKEGSLSNGMSLTGYVTKTDEEWIMTDIKKTEKSQNYD